MMLIHTFGPSFWCLSDIENCKRSQKCCKSKVLWTFTNASTFTLRLFSGWFLDLSGPLFFLNWVMPKWSCLRTFGFPFEINVKHIWKSWLVNFWYSWRSSRNVNLTDLLPTIGPNKHDFGNENGVPKVHLGRQGSTQSGLVGQAISLQECFV